MCRCTGATLPICCPAQVAALSTSMSKQAVDKETVASQLQQTLIEKDHARQLCHVMEEEAAALQGTKETLLGQIRMVCSGVGMQQVNLRRGNRQQPQGTGGTYTHADTTTINSQRMSDSFDTKRIEK